MSQQLGADRRGADAMFKWICLGVAILFLGAVGWMINDIRLQVRRSAVVVDRIGTVVRDDLPNIIDSSKKTSVVVSTNLPEVVEKVRDASDTLPTVVERVDRTTEVVGELAEDLRQLKELAGLTHAAKDKSVVAYAESVLKAIESSGGEIGMRKNVGSGLKNTRPAADWVREERREAVFLAVLGKSKKEMLNAIVKNKLGFAWYIQLPGQKSVKLLDWLKENHAETKGLV
jgi:hypothetical protein